MRRTRRFLVSLTAGAGAVAAITTATPALAQPQPPLPQCVDTGGAEAAGGSTTMCATPGNVQINSTPADTTYLYPWEDEFYGPALIIGGGGGWHGGGGPGGR
ncbi:hypothetical protein [Mycobacterium deserti]|uniref:Keratin associated protein n=1 Tax=Mycobacterium deserti TaxID=2978347 RepID=A0ABT2M6A9_9MYCO|nr:hypothetical protein [Mycobacterium deserti]MCT7657461.1 hypothetical protein [Mycobacterium deserti]